MGLIWGGAVPPQGAGWDPRKGSERGERRGRRAGWELAGRADSAGEKPAVAAPQRWETGRPCEDRGGPSVQAHPGPDTQAIDGGPAELPSSGYRLAPA